jgi:Putative zinc-finger
MVLECKHVWEHISGYLDGTLSREVLEQVQKHLEHCEICSAILDSTRNILILTADERVFELPLGFSERLHARLEKEIQALATTPGASKEDVKEKSNPAKPDESSDE